MQIQIDTTDRLLLFELMENSESLEPRKTQIVVPGDIKVTYEDMTIRESSGAYDTITFIITQVLGPVGINLFSNWLYEKLSKSKSKIKAVRIEKRTVLIEKEDIQRTLEEVTQTSFKVQITEEITTEE